MPLHSARLNGDLVLESCLAGTHRMLAGEEGLPVMRVQSALIDLGYPVGPKGADGIFGLETGNAVTAYKTEKRLVPSDPVVGPGTTQALDNDLLVNPPTLFGDFTSAVLDHRLEPFVARELVAFSALPANSWRHMLGMFALNALNSGALLGIVAQSSIRVRDQRVGFLRDRFLKVADPGQPRGDTAVGLFDKSAGTFSAFGETVVFRVAGQPRAFIIIADDVIRGRAFQTRGSNKTKAPMSLQGVLAHELTHARNLANSDALENIADTDTNAYVDTALAQERSASGVPTSRVLGRYVEELIARHVHWLVLKELAGTSGEIAVRGLPADELAAAALYYFTNFRKLYDPKDRNGYSAGIIDKGDAVRQIDLWLRLCATQSFSDNPLDDQQSKLVFQAASQFCADQVASRTLDATREDGMDGVFFLPKDFG